MCTTTRNPASPPCTNLYASVPRLLPWVTALPLSPESCDKSRIPAHSLGPKECAGMLGSSQLSAVLEISRPQVSPQWSERFGTGGLTPMRATSLGWPKTLLSQSKNPPSSHREGASRRAANLFYGICDLGTQRHNGPEASTARAPRMLTCKFLSCSHVHFMHVGTRS